MDRKAVDRAFELANRGVGYEEEAERAHDRNDAGEFQRLRKYASEHYSQAVEILLSQKGSGKCAAVMNETVLMVMARLEAMVSVSTPVEEEARVAIAIDPVKGKPKFMIKAAGEPRWRTNVICRNVKMKRGERLHRRY